MPQYKILVTGISDEANEDTLNNLFYKNRSIIECKTAHKMNWFKKFHSFCKKLLHLEPNGGRMEQTRRSGAVRMQPKE